MRKPHYIQVEKTQGPAENVKLIAIHTIDRAKQATLIQLVETHRPYLAVIFCRTKRRVSKLYEVLRSHKFLCDELHGDLSQAKRERVMKRFRDGEIQLLIATDVAARGLDVEGVTHVFNYDIPQDAESFVHRIGRTGRAGTKGLAITLYSTDDRPTLDMIEKELNINIQKQNIGNTGSNQQNNQEPSKQKTNQGKKDEKQRATGGNRRDSKPKASFRNSGKPKSGKSKQSNSNPAGGRSDRKSSTTGFAKSRRSK
jgi:ATP-dependent RNA helicase DeaD